MVQDLKDDRFNRIPKSLDELTCRIVALGALLGAEGNTIDCVGTVDNPDIQLGNGNEQGGGL